MVRLDEKAEARTQKLHSESIVVDSCNTAAMWDEDYILNRLVPSGVNVIVKSVPDIGGYQETAPQLAKMFSWMRRFDEHITRAVSMADIKSALPEGKISVIYGFQDCKPLDGNIDFLEIYYEMGIRVMQLTYNSRGYAGDGCLERNDGGLSNWGLKLVEKMNKLGMIVDLSHASSKTAAEILEASTKPVICSHSNCKALVNSPRNIEDDLVSRIAETNGYIGVTTFLAMVSEDWNRTPSLDEVIDHVDHVVKIAGSHCVGFGLDLPEGLTSRGYQSFDFAHSYPSWEQHSKHLVREIESVRQAINLTRVLVNRDYSDSQIQAILGNNFLRVLEEVVG